MSSTHTAYATPQSPLCPAWMQLVASQHDVMLLVENRPTPIVARAHSIENGAMVLITSTVLPLSAMNHAPCALSYSTNGQWHTSLARIQSTSFRADGRYLIVVNPPTCVASEARRHPRFRNNMAHPVRARVLTNERAWHPTVRDLSEGGVGLDFHQGSPGWTPGTLVRIELTNGCEHIQLMAMVMRNAGRRVGLAFGPFSDWTPLDRIQLQNIIDRLRSAKTHSPTLEIVS